MFQIDSKSRKSIYEQVIDNIKELIIRNVLPPQSKLPSVRELSKQLLINPNTVQKAFHLLEEESLMESRTGAKSCMTLPPETLARLRREVLSDELRAMARTLRQMGISRDEALHLLGEAWKEEET